MIPGIREGKYSMTKCRLLLSVISIVFLASCVTAPKLDITTFQVDTKPPVAIPAVCKSSYEAAAAKSYYVLQTKSSPNCHEIFALTNIGRKQGIKVGSVADIYLYREIIEHFSKKSTCEILKVPVKSTATDLMEVIQDDKAWFLIEGDPNDILDVRVGALVTIK